MAGAGHRKGTEHEREIIRTAQIRAQELKRAWLASAPAVDCIPGYTITREIGRGGMAVIYEAQQKEPPRAVALKVMRGGATVSKHRLRLFRQEMETLARLSCPNIAAIYGAGTTNDGRHYFAMELVRGSPVTEYVHLQNLSLRQILELFQQICQAVHYAHQRGVIHRDLKPSNIMVDGDGNPKVLDFGLARMVETDDAVRAMMSESGKIMGTLPYMSPEQAEGDQDGLDIRTDVYSLGVILYELLTDRLPYDVPPTDPLQVRQAIIEQPPCRPSRYRRSVRGELELIVLKALEKEPAKRYQSALALGEDLGRFLRGQAISARTPTIPYLVRKFIARQKLPVALTTVLLATLAGFAGWERIQANQRRLDEQQRQQSLERWQQKTRAEIRDLLRIGQFCEAVVMEVAGRDVLDEAAERIDGTFVDSAAPAATVREILARRYAALGETERAARERGLAAAALRKSARQRIEHRDWAAAEALLLREYDIRRKFDEAGARETARLLADVYGASGRPQRKEEWLNRADAPLSTDGNQ